MRELAVPISVVTGWSISEEILRLISALNIQMKLWGSAKKIE
jgi:hypothetical protein